MRVSICILTYNRASILKELLESLRKVCYSPLEIIVVDNDSNDETESVVRRDFPEIRYYKMPGNEGVAGRNKGISEAKGDIVITLDDDVIGIGDHEIEVLLELFAAKPNVGAICFKILDYGSGEICNWCHHYKKEEFCDREFLTDEITEGAVAFRKSVFPKCGLYPTNFFISYEGADLACRMLNVGYKTIYSPAVCVRHRTAKEGRKNWRRYYYDTRNQIWFVVRNYPFLWGLKYLARGLPAMLFYSLRDGYFRYWVQGLWDAAKKMPDVLESREPIDRQSLKILKEISKHRPSLSYMLRQRLFKRKISL